MNQAQESILDGSRPNAGRVYDYLLGGNHNFEIDRKAGEHLKSVAPSLPLTVRLQRWCLRSLATELTVQRGFDVIIDFASGLPTNGHIHYVVPPGTVVIYSDWDPVVIEYAHDILKNTPNVHYFHADARQPEDLLSRPEVVDLLDGRRDVAVVYWGVAAFLTDNDIMHAAQVLYEWAGPKSCWAFNAQGADIDESSSISSQGKQIYENMGSPIHIRSLERYKQLLCPWQADEKGFVPMLSWHGFDQTKMRQEDYHTWGPSGGGYGVYLIK